MIKIIIFVLMLPVVAYVGLCLLFFVDSNRFVINPSREVSKLQEVQQKYPNLQKVSYSLPEGKRLYAWYQKPGKKGKIVLFTHGNSHSLNRFVGKITPWIDSGYGILAIEYEGFGEIPGHPTQFVMERDAKTAVKWLESQGYEHKDIILYGHSLGTYMATYLAAEMGQADPFDAVILDAPFLSAARAAADIGRNRYFVPFPVDWLIGDRFASDELIRKINTRLFVGHGKMDEVIPYYQGVELFNKALKEKAFFSSDLALHETLHQHGFFEAVWKWL